MSDLRTGNIVAESSRGLCAESTDWDQDFVRSGRKSLRWMAALGGLAALAVACIFQVGCTGLTSAGSPSKSSSSSSSSSATPPTISITSPTSGATVSGTVIVSASVSANATSVQYKVDGNNIGAAITNAPFGSSLNTASLSNGVHSLTAVASDSVGQTAASAVVAITVSNPADTPPTISITSPGSGATVSGTVAIAVAVSANTTGVQYRVDGTNSGAAITAAPFGLSLNTTTIANGTHSLTAVASNAASQTTTSAAVTITVNNVSSTPPTISITKPASGATVSGVINVAVMVSANTTSVQYKVDGANSGAAITTAPFGFSLSTTTLSNGSHSLDAVASNAAAQTSSSIAISITVANADTTPPSISLTAPAAGSTVSRSVTVAATASDNVGVTRVEFYLDNVLQTTDTSSPYTWTWNTTSASNTVHSILAKAYDAAANSTTASETVTVSNASSGGGGLTSSGPVSLSGQNGTVIQNLHITNPNGDCVTISNSTNITIRQSEIGPCKGNGIVVSGGNTISVFDNYIHPEGTLAGCCDITDGIFSNGTQNLTVQGNVIAYGEANIEAQNQTMLKVIGNFFLNPRGGANSRGQNVQVFYGSSNVLVQNNYTLASTDTATYAFPEDQEDSINFGGSPSGSSTTGIVAQNNYITGGHSASGCGLIADTAANSAQFLSNTLVNTGQCGIGIADGTNQLVDSNKILNATPVNGGGNTAIYVWKVTSSDPACGPVTISNNVASAIASDGSANSFWNGGGCGTVTMTNDTFDAAAQQALSPASQKLPPPAIPPLPNTCVIASPFSNNTAFPPCGGSGTGPTSPSISIASPVSGATTSGTVNLSVTVSSSTTTVQYKVDGNNVGAALTSAPFGLSLDTTTLSNGVHMLTAVASNSASQSTTSAAVSVTVNNPKVVISTTSLPGGQVQVAYSTTMQATGGTAPYSWSVANGTLPAGLGLSSNGTLSGTPSAAGSFTATILVTDGANHTASAGFSVTIATAAPPSSSAPFGHVFIVVEENANYSDVIGSSSMPYLKSLAMGYGLATRYYADTHPSIGNYMMLTTGQVLTNDDSQTPQTFPVSADNVVRELLAAGKTWKAYAENIPSVGYTGGDSGEYAVRHVPLAYMTDVQNNTAQAQNLVPFTQFATDLSSGSLPNFSFITPNLCDDAHDCALSAADSWLQTNIDPLIKSATFQKDGLLIIVFDESGNDNTNGGGLIPAIVVSPFAKNGYESTTVYQHESTLRLILEGLGVTNLPGASAAAPKMWEFFTFTPPT